MAKAVMIQGTMSGAGKSLLAAGLCRVFAQDGFRVMPFKSQNMALNSFVTEEGLEMGRAQVMQALAAGVKPTVAMNPILLKPTDVMGSQVIVNGEILGNMSAAEYFGYKRKLIPQILKAYEKLQEQADIIVIEGAGSPAEINLKENDIVNMGLAELLDVPVLLAGDIDRGGVFAQLYGTVMLLEPWERQRIFGLIINKFRGDRGILEPGIAMIEEKVNIPVVGVVPYEPLDLEEEDSMSQRLSSFKETGAVDIAVVRLPRISNYTDFLVLETIREVSVRYVTRPEELKNADMVILPGTKNTISDMEWLREQGFEKVILQMAGEGTVIFGICGGFQMLGETIKDPLCAEGGGEIQGLGLLPMDTVFGKEKVRSQVKGEVLSIGGALKKMSCAPVAGYEIHMGHTMLHPGGSPFALVKDMSSGEEKADGGCRGNVYGTYLHGIFDEGETAKELMYALGKAKGIECLQITEFDFKKHREEQYDKLAEMVRENCDLEKIYGRMGIHESPIRKNISPGD